MQGEDDGEIDRRRVDGVLDSCARDSMANTERVWERKLIFDYDHISSYKANRERRMGKTSRVLCNETRVFERADAGSDDGFTAHQGLYHHGPR